MTTRNRAAARAVADVAEGRILASVEIAAPPERVFRALTSDEIVKWWGSDEMYRTTEFSADLRVGGKWRSLGRGADGTPFAVEGEYLELDPPRKVVQTWRPDWDAGSVSTVTYLLEPTATGTKLTLRHDGFVGRAESCQSHSQGWPRVLGWLDAHLSASEADTSKYFMCRLLPPRPTFAFDMSDAERQVMLAHGAYWRQKLVEGIAIAFGPVADPNGGWGLGVLRVPDEAALDAMTSQDPAIVSGLGFSYQKLPMLTCVFRGG
jgi:uncharacterized protein YndB with AHSA1/START domain